MPQTVNGLSGSGNAAAQSDAAPGISTAALHTIDGRTVNTRQSIKVTAAPPDCFSQVDLETDIEDWLMQVQDKCVFGKLETEYWVHYATGYLGGQPKLLWAAHRKEDRLTDQTDVMQWTSFTAWCRKHLSIQNRDKVAFDELFQFVKQTGSVSSYVSSFNVLCLQAKVPDDQKMHYWYDGLASDVRSKTEYDPVTKQCFASVVDAQPAALAVDSFHYCDYWTLTDAGATDYEADNQDDSLDDWHQGTEYDCNPDCDPDCNPEKETNPENGEHQTFPDQLEELPYYAVRKRKCYKCGRPGHIAQNCEAEHDDQNLPAHQERRTCFACGVRGHIAENCAN